MKTICHLTTLLKVVLVAEQGVMKQNQDTIATAEDFITSLVVIYVRSTVMHCTVLFTVLHCTVLYCTVGCTVCIVHCTALHCTGHSTALYCSRHSRHCTVQCTVHCTALIRVLYWTSLICSVLNSTLTSTYCKWDSFNQSNRVSWLG